MLWKGPDNRKTISLVEKRGGRNDMVQCASAQFSSVRRSGSALLTHFFNMGFVKSDGL